MLVHLLATQLSRVAHPLKILESLRVLGFEVLLLVLEVLLLVLDLGALYPLLHLYFIILLDQGLEPFAELAVAVGVSLSELLVVLRRRKVPVLFLDNGVLIVGGLFGLENLDLLLLTGGVLVRQKLL